MSDAPLRHAYFVSDRTGITAEMLGHSLLSQFEGVHFVETTLPFVDSVDKARAAVREIDAAAAATRARPLVFSTLVDPQVAAEIARADALFLDCFQVFISPMERELGISHTVEIGRSHRVKDNAEYTARIDAVNFVMAHDDGVTTKEFSEADIILVGVSRCGKTPTCLYMGLQYGIRAANYPLIPEDLEGMQLPSRIDKFRRKLFGLTIDPVRLAQIRHERRPGSRYADLDNCRHEVERAELLMQQEGIAFLDTTSRSIEELAALILHQGHLQRHIF
jgi:hypothetical protein